jgi:hypothetical protein
MTKQALIDPNQLVETGYRVAQVEDSTNIFPVANPLFWTPCVDNIIADQYWYNPVDQSFNLVPIPTPKVNSTTVNSTTTS